MMWKPEDWSHAVPAGELVRSICRLLACIPERGAQRVACLDRPAMGQVAFLAAHFAEVVVLRGDRFASDPPSSRATDRGRRYDLIVSPRPTDFERVVDLDRRLEAWFGRLTEGGLIVATFPAIRRHDGGAALPLVDGEAPRPCRGFHEVELQYRLRRAGFRGLRLRRLVDETDGEILLCIAVRRANN